jgi:hypothetical protein
MTNNGDAWVTVNFFCQQALSQSLANKHGLNVKPAAACGAGFSTGHSQFFQK